MNAFLTGVQTYILSWQSGLAVVVLIIAAYSWMRGHHFAACMEMLAALAIIFTATQVATQIGL